MTQILIDRRRHSSISGVRSFRAADCDTDHYLVVAKVRERLGKPDGKKPLGRPRRRWVDNIKMDLREIGWDGMAWIGLIWLRIGTNGGLL
jgi:hypothetical protein